MPYEYVYGVQTKEVRSTVCDLLVWMLLFWAVEGCSIFTIDKIMLDYGFDSKGRLSYWWFSTIKFT